MNLTALLRKDAAIEDHSLVDHTWLQDGSVMDLSSIRNPNNIKPQVEIEWGLGGPDIDMNEPAGEVKRNIPEENLGDANAVILFARDMMNRGFRGRQVVAALRGKYPPVLLAKASKGLRAMFQLEGIVGRIMVDARGYKDCRAAMKRTANSPYKRFIKYVYGCHCGDPMHMHANDSGVVGAIEASSGNGFDDFLAAKDATAALVSHCRSTLMPIMASQGDLDKSLLDGTLTEMMNLTPVPQTVVKQVWAMKVSNLAKIRAAFRWLDNQVDAAEDAKYAGKVDASEFQVRQADNELDILAPAMADMEVDGTNPSLMTDIEPRAAVPTNFDGPRTLPGLFDDLEMTPQQDQSQIPVELMDERGGAAQVQIDAPAVAPRRQIVENRQVNLNVEFFTPGAMDIVLDGEQEVPLNEARPALSQLDVNPQAGELDATAPELGIIDIDLADSPEPEFVGTDEIVFDDPVAKPADLDVSMAPDQDIEL